MYKIFVYSSPTAMPLSIFRHAWIVTECDGVYDRFEVSWSTTFPAEQSFGYFYKNPPQPKDKGVTVWFTHRPTKSTPRWNGRVDSQIEGDTDSVACVIYKFLHSYSVTSYPYLHKYSFFLGPNSNAFVDWILEMFPHSCLKKHPLALSGLRFLL